MRGLLVGCLLLGGCARSASPAVVPEPPPALAPVALLTRLELAPLEDARPAAARERRPGVAGALERGVRSYLGERLGAGGPRLRLRLLEDEGLLAPVALRVEATIEGAAGEALWRAQLAAAGGSERVYLDFFHTLGARLDAVLTLGVAALPARPTRASAGVFVLEREGRRRGVREVVYVEAASGQVLRHEAEVSGEQVSGRPGEWLLSRRTVEGLQLSGEAYEELARALRPRYDLRALGDAYRYHFFGLREPGSTVTPAAGERRGGGGG